MMMLEIETFEDFLTELVQPETIRIAIIDKTNEGAVASKVVYTAKREDHIIRYLEEFAPRLVANPEAKATFDKIIQDRRTSLAAKGIGFTNGMWSV